MSATIYTHKESNIRKTWLLFTLFLGVVIGIGYVMSQVYGNPSILFFAVLFSIFTSVTSYWYSDKLVLAMTRATPVTMQTNPELYRIVENLSITAGLPMPRLYTIPEIQINAFATGRNPEHAVVAVTEGALRKLSRVELEGVLAHELSHIGNRDMLVSTVAVVLVGFISLTADFFTRSMIFGGHRSNDRGNGGVFVLIGIVLSILAPIAATLMQLAISRKREALADATGVLLTRYPEGLASALQKIHDDTAPMRVAANNTTSHLWIDDPYNRTGKTPWLHKLFMSHPPIEERIKALREMGGRG